MEKKNSLEDEHNVIKAQKQIMQACFTLPEKSKTIQRFVITTRSFSEEGFFLENDFAKVINSDISNSQWRKISLPIYLLDFFSGIGFDVIRDTLKNYNSVLEQFDKYEKLISQLLIKESEIDNNEVETVYSIAKNVLSSLVKIICRNSYVSSSFESALSSNSNNLSETVKYKLDDLILFENESDESLFDCYKCEVNVNIKSLTTDAIECYVVRSFNRKISKCLGEKYINSLFDLFGPNADFVIHDYDCGMKLLQGDFVYSSNKQDYDKNVVLLFKHNKGDVYQILKNGSFSLLYLYVTRGCILKRNVHFFISLLDSVLCKSKIHGNITNSEEVNIRFVNNRRVSLDKLCDEIICIRDTCLNDKDRAKIEQSLNKLKDCLKIELSSYCDLYKLMFNLMELEDYVLCKSNN